jgi:hypothetical protein
MYRLVGQARLHQVNFNEDARTVLLQRLIGAGEFKAAIEEYRRFTGWASTALPSNREFKSVPRYAPLDWRLADAPEAFAQVASYSTNSAGMLQIEARRGVATTLAQQLISAPPGDFVLSSQWNAEAGQDKTALEWVVRCVKPDKIISRLPLRLMPTDRTLSAHQSLTIPEEGCDFQWIELFLPERRDDVDIAAEIKFVRLDPIKLR